MSSLKAYGIEVVGYYASEISEKELLIIINLICINFFCSTVVDSEQQ